MIPVTDALRSRTLPYVNVALIIANIAVFIYELTLNEREISRFFFQHGVVPARLVGWVEDPSGLREALTVLSSAFIHGGWLHIAGNMVFLWVFGDNVEDALGHVRYLLFYLVAAIAAVALQVFLDQDSIVPLVGASGAIAGVLGAYLVLYPRATVGVVIPFFWFFGAMPVPAVFLIGFWFLLQLMSGVAAIGASEASEGVAFWAHVGGFGFGFLIALLLRPFIGRGSLSGVRRGYR